MKKLRFWGEAEPAPETVDAGEEEDEKEEEEEEEEEEDGLLGVAAVFLATFVFFLAFF